MSLSRNKFAPLFAAALAFSVLAIPASAMADVPPTPDKPEASAEGEAGGDAAKPEEAKLDDKKAEGDKADDKKAEDKPEEKKSGCSVGADADGSGLALAFGLGLVLLRRRN